MVDLQTDHGPLQMKSRMKPRRVIDFDHNRTLAFDKRSVRDLALRDFSFEKWRRLYWEVIIEGTIDSTDQAKELNIQGVQHYKDGRLKEAKWFFAKALSIDPGYENARRNLRTINKKLSERKQKKRSEARKGKKFREISDEMDGRGQDVKRKAQKQASQPLRVDSQPSWSRNYRCPGCSIPVRDNWVMCTNCGTDLRRYPPIPY